MDSVWLFGCGIVLLVISIFGFHYYFLRYRWFLTELAIYTERKIRVSKSDLNHLYWRINKNLIGMFLMIIFIGLGLWLVNEWLFDLGILFLIYLTK